MSAQSAPTTGFTDKQGKSGHGLEAQRATVEAFARSHNWPIIGEFTEIETGKRNDRPQLNAALKACKKQQARLVIAKLDRLSRKLAARCCSGQLQCRQDEFRSGNGSRRCSETKRCGKCRCATSRRNSTIEIFLRPVAARGEQHR
jgi:Resolvase, N terminal domain